MYKVVGFNLKYMKRQLRTADDIKAEGIQTRTYRRTVDGRKWDNLELNAK